MIEAGDDDPPVERPEALVAAMGTPPGPGGRRAEPGREATRAAWSAIARGYDELVTPSHLWLGEQGLRRADVAAGMTLLDVAARTGALSIPAARRGAKVLATDLSPAMLDRLRARAPAEGLAIETRPMDGHALDLPDAAFDVAGSQFG